MVSRRTLVGGALGILLARFAHAQPGTRMARVGLFANSPEPQWETFRKTLRERGWVEGQNLVLDERWLMGDARRAAELAANLVGLTHPPALKVIESSARQLGLLSVMAEAKSAEDLDAAFAAMVRERAEALLVVPSPLAFRERGRLAELCMAHRLPAMFGFRQNVEAGGLLSYGVDIQDQIARAAVYVDRVLRGAKPAELPVEQATKFELAINLKTAKALGLTLSQGVRLRADRVVE
jgi:ABC transporter substrate binding protein